MRTNISWLLEHYKLSQNQLAQLSGVTQSRLNRALTTTAQPRLDMVKSIADVFEIPVGLLFEGDVSKVKNLPDRMHLTTKLIERQIDEMRNIPPGLRKLMAADPSGDDSRLHDLALHLGVADDADEAAASPPAFSTQLVRDGVKASNGGKYFEVIRRVRDALVHAQLQPDPEAYTRLLAQALKHPDDEELVHAMIELLRTKHR